MAIELVFFVQILSCPNFIFDVLWYIDLIFGLWLYLDDLQFKFEFRSGPMIFGRGMVLGLWNLAKYLVVTTLFHYDWDIDYIQEILNNLQNPYFVNLWGMGDSP
jgi:hypothetical protein